MTQKNFALPRGTNDILPADVTLWQRIEAKARQIFSIYGYKEIRTPFFEETELFIRSMGEISDVVEKQMLNVRSSKKSDAQDIGENSLSLRPEGTASIVRSYIENSFDKKESLSKLFYIGPMFRGERPQKGRLRQFHQIGVEAIGPDGYSPYLDAEVIALSVEILKNFGLSGFQLKINTLGALENKGKFRDFLKKELKGKLRELCSDCQDRFERNVFRILDCKNKDCKQVVRHLDLSYNWLDEESKDYFSKVKEALNLLNVSFEEDPTLVRGLDYYTHTVFEVTHASLGSQDALGAGGRYNSLVTDLGGACVGAVGFALGIERILLSLPQEQNPKEENLKVFVIALDETSVKIAFQILNILRREGIKADMSFRVSSVKSLMRLADKSAAPFVILIGENERKGEFVTLKNMRQGTQEEVSFKGLDCGSLVEKISVSLRA